MGSTRLPRKMLQLLGPYTLIEWVVKRVKQCKVFDRVVLATSYKKCDDQLVELVKSMGVDISEEKKVTFWIDWLTLLESIKQKQ